MFDPVIFDNLKIALEGAVYDLDLSGRIQIVSRSDLVDLSSVSREFTIGFRTKPDANAIAEMVLYASLSDLAAELLNGETKEAGCMIEIKFYTSTSHPQSLCEHIQNGITTQWEGRPALRQTVSYEYGQASPEYHITVSLQFGRKLNEQHIEDLPRLLDYTVESLQWLSEISLSPGD